MKKFSDGFTMIELLVVVAIIGILATIGIVSFSNIQAGARDSQRSSQVTVLSEALEKYYEANGEYPSCADMTKSGDIISQDILKGVDPAVLVTPTEKDLDNSIICSNIAGESGPDVFAYVGDGSSTCSTGSSCLEWTLKYREEATGEIITLESRHQASIANAGSTTLTTQIVGFTQINASWTPVNNASSYVIQRATNGSFTTGLAEATVATTSHSFTGLTQGTTYYLRVLPKASSSDGGWSATKSVTMPVLTSVTVSATANSSTQITASWNSSSLATSYTLQYATNSSFTSATSLSGLTGLSRAVTGLSTGVTYYFRVQAVASGATSSWSNTANATTIVPAPASAAAATNSATQITASWASVSIANTYELEYSRASDFSSGVTSISGLTGTSRAVTGLLQGQRYYFRVFAFVGTTSSNASSTANATTTMNKPATPTYASPSYFNNRVY
ncbi:MAG TPA: fibronectin type III domain-containing protein, partial [Candidatus Saccharimonadales bacterium]|nr:fibronectin type III domain-containing protein [Candidatus Saccharimonadales bacterium]